jgi:hypothetical protein
MAYLGAGVGGGLLAAAGAVGGLGQGMVAGAQQQMKLDYGTKMNELAKQREEAITRLRGEQEASMQQSGIAAQKEQQQAGFGEEEKMTGIKIGAASRAAGATREFEATQNAAQRASAEKRSGISAGARVKAAEVTASGRVTAAALGREKSGAKDPNSEFKIHTVKQFGPNGQPLPDILVMQHGADLYRNFGNKVIRANADGSPTYDPKSLRNAAPQEIQDLLQDPMGKVPAGANAGMPKWQAFEQARGYLPPQVLDSIQNAQNRQSQGQSSLPPAFLKGVGGPNATSSVTNSFGGGKDTGADENEDQGAADNASQADEDESNNEAPFQSGAMGSYGAMTQ